MRSAVAGATKRGLYGVGHYARRLRGDAFPGVAVLCYHGILPDTAPADTMPFAGLHVRASELESHCRLIREVCDPVSLAQWRAALDGGPPLPRRPALLTFDDGYRSVLTVGRPILERHGIPAAVFITSEAVARRRLFWYDAAARALGEGEVERWKQLPHAEWRAASAAHGADAVADDPCAPLTPDDVGELGATPGIEVGGHGASHAILAHADRDTQRDEIQGNRATLEAWTGLPVRAFAYPNGRPGEDYSAATVEILDGLGFDFGFTTQPGFARPQGPPLERSRFLMLAGVSAAELAHRLAYSWRR